MRPHPDAKQRETAASIDRDDPLWLVMWGTASRRYWAYPTFNVPKGTILSAADPGELLTQMRQIEMRYLPPPPRYQPRQT
jgi:hypothetical protein